MRGKTAHRRPSLLRRHMGRGANGGLAKPLVAGRDRELGEHEGDTDRPELEAVELDVRIEAERPRRHAGP